MARRGKVWFWLLGFAIGGAAIVWARYSMRSLVTPARVRMELSIHLVASYTLSRALQPEDRPLALPKGDIHAFYRWVMDDEYMRRALDIYAWTCAPDAPAETFRDLWGNELVYVFPPRHKDLFFELYSVGPNGEDEQGGGDDVTAGPHSSLSAHSDVFSKGLVDLDWVQVHLLELRRNPEDGKIIGVSPEKLYDQKIPGTRTK